MKRKERERERREEEDMEKELFFLSDFGKWFLVC